MNLFAQKWNNLCDQIHSVKRCFLPRILAKKTNRPCLAKATERTLPCSVTLFGKRQSADQGRHRRREEPSSGREKSTTVS